MAHSISEEAILQWEKFPELIRNDKCFVAFRAEFERLQGKKSNIDKWTDVLKSTGHPMKIG